jgi:hypothetical protein
MRNNCPYYTHRFDPETHRCKGCQRWQAGYAPKKAATKERAECQVCAKVQATHAGALVHHGYKRPGWGCIVGDCYGAGYAPFPAHDRLDAWLAQVETHKATLEQTIAAGEPEEIVQQEIDYDAPRRYGQKHATKLVTYTRAPSEGPHPDGAASEVRMAWVKAHQAHEKWTSLVRARAKRLTGQVEECVGEIARVSARIERAKAQQALVAQAAQAGVGNAQ